MTRLQIGEAPHEMLERKPNYGTPCNNCGVCCFAFRCPLSQHVFKLKEQGPCPALQKTGDHVYTCGLVNSPQLYAPARAMSKGRAALSRAAAAIIGAGNGCDAHLVSEGKGKAYDEACNRLDALALAGVRQFNDAKILWGAPSDKFIKMVER
jgi:hypothetical protein